MDPAPNHLHHGPTSKPVCFQLRTKMTAFEVKYTLFVPPSLSTLGHAVLLSGDAVLLSGDAVLLSGDAVLLSGDVLLKDW